VEAHLVSIGHFLFSSRDYLFPLTFFVLLLTTLPTFPFGSTRADEWLDVLGILAACFGQGCRFLAAGRADNIRRRGYQRQIGAKALIEDGVFAHVRNPLYLGNFLIVTGFVLIANNLWWYLLVLPGCGGISLSFLAVVLSTMPLSWLKRTYSCKLSETSMLAIATK